MNSISDADRADLLSQCAQVTNTCMRKIWAEMPKTPECLDAFEQWQGAVHLLHKHGPPAQEFVNGTFAEFRKALQQAE